MQSRAHVSRAGALFCLLARSLAEEKEKSIGRQIAYLYR